MSEKREWSSWVTVVMVLLSFLGGIAMNAWTLAGSLATKPMIDQVYKDSKGYTDDRADQLKRYTDALAENVKQEAYSHSDKNRAEMQQMIIMQSGDIKAQGVKMDMVLDAVRELRTSSRRGK